MYAIQINNFNSCLAFDITKISEVNVSAFIYEHMQIN